MKTGNRLPDWAAELRFISRRALAYCRNLYEREGFDRIQETAPEMTAEVHGQSEETVCPEFCAEAGYQRRRR